MKKPQPPKAPKPFNLYMIIRRVGEREIIPVYAHSEIQAITFYVHGIEQPWREKEFRAHLLEAPAKRQPRSYRRRHEAYLARYADYVLEYGQP